MRLKEYLNKKNMPYREFAKLLGIDANYFYQIICGARPLPKKFWKKVISLTSGMVSIEDIFQDQFKDNPLNTEEGKCD